MDTDFRLSLIRNLDSVIQNSAKLKLEKVGETDFATAKSYLRKHAEVIPKLTDWTSLVIMRRNSVSKDPFAGRRLPGREISSRVQVGRKD